MLHRFAVLAACLTFPLIFAGATVTTKDAALSVPDWPLSYGSPFPRMVGNIVYEHSHCVIAGLVGVSTLVLAVWIHFGEERGWVRVLGWIALGAVLLQATLGGMTVLFLRPAAVSAVHACLAQAFFALVSSIALITSPGWEKAGRPHPDPRPAGQGRRALVGLFIATAALVYLQVVLGAVVRHTGAALSIPDFPLSFGKYWPSAEEMGRQGVLVQVLHRGGALAVTLVACSAAVLALRSRAEYLRTPAVLVLVILPLQVLLGASTVWSGREYLPATAHVAFGGLLLVSSVALALRGGRALPARRGTAPAFVRRAGIADRRAQEALA